MSSRMPLHLVVMHQYRRHTPEDVHRRTMRSVIEHTVCQDGAITGDRLLCRRRALQPRAAARRCRAQSWTPSRASEIRNPESKFAPSGRFCVRGQSTDENFKNLRPGSLATVRRRAHERPGAVAVQNPLWATGGGSSSLAWSRGCAHQDPPIPVPAYLGVRRS